MVFIMLMHTLMHLQHVDGYGDLLWQMCMAWMDMVSAMANVYGMDGYDLLWQMCMVWMDMICYGKCVWYDTDCCCPK